MIKRVVILQDEQLVVREIQRNMQRAAAAPCSVAAVAPGGDGGGGRRCPVARRRRRDAGLLRRRPSSTADEATRRAGAGRGSGGGSLASVAKAASMKAERAAIEQTLAAGALEPAQGGADSRRELQDAAQQDQGVRHQPRLSRIAKRESIVRDHSLLFYPLAYLQ